MCKRCHGIYKVVFGALLLLNAFVWPLWGTSWDGSGWIAWLGVLMVLGGGLKLLVPNKCSGCAAMSATAPAKGKKK